MKALSPEDFLKEIKNWVKNNVLLLFGEKGSGKTTICLLISKACKTIFVDTEGGVDPDEIPENTKYYECPKLDDMIRLIDDLAKKPKEYDAIIVDSIGMLIYPSLAGKSLKERSEIFLKRGQVMFALRVLARQHGKLVVLTTQPDYFASGGESLEGAKYLHLAKEIWKCKRVFSNPSRTVIEVETWRSKKAGMGKKLFRIVITDRGVEVYKLF